MFCLFFFQVKRSLQNFRRDVPYQMAYFGVTYLTAEHQWNKDELLSCIDGKTKRKTYPKNPFSCFFLKVLQYMISNHSFLEC
jgi:hypothetical protein